MSEPRCEGLAPFCCGNPDCPAHVVGALPAEEWDELAGLFDLLAAANANVNESGARAYRSAAKIVREHGALAAQRAEANRLAALPQGPTIERRDRYTINVEGVNVRATDDQERRIRAMTDEQRARFLRVMGQDGETGR